MKYVYLICVIALSACAPSFKEVPVGENVFVKHPVRPIFKDAVYAEPDFYSDCMEYMMEECFY